MTVVEKILAHASGLRSVAFGETVEPAVDVAMSHENAALVINQFMEIYQGTGLGPRVWNASRIAIIFDHRVPAESAKTATNRKKIREFVEQQGITRFHDIRGDEGGPATRFCARAVRCAQAMSSLASAATRQLTELWGLSRSGSALQGARFSWENRRPCSTTLLGMPYFR